MTDSERIPSGSVGLAELLYRICEESTHLPCGMRRDYWDSVARTVQRHGWTRQGVSPEDVEKCVRRWCENDMGTPATEYAGNLRDKILDDIRALATKESDHD